VKHILLHISGSWPIRVRFFYSWRIYVSSSASVAPWPSHSQEKCVSEYRYDTLYPQKSRIFCKRTIYMSAHLHLLQLGLCIRKNVVCQSTNVILCIRKRAVFSAKKPCICQFICIVYSLAFASARMSRVKVRIWYSVTATELYFPQKSPIYVNLSTSLTAEPLDSQECRVSEYRYDRFCPQKSRVFRKRTLYKRALCVNSSTSLTAWPLHLQNGHMSEFKHDHVNLQKSCIFRNRALQLSPHLYDLQRDLCVRVNVTCQNTYMTVYICKRAVFSAKEPYVPQQSPAIVTSSVCFAA